LVFAVGGIQLTVAVPVAIWPGGGGGGVVEEDALAEREPSDQRRPEDQLPGKEVRLV